MGATNTTNSTGIGTLGMQNTLGPNIGNPSAMGAPSSSLNGLGNTSVGQGGQGIDALSQAYSGIQQYAGLSGLLGQGKDRFFLRFRLVAVCALFW